MRTLGVDLAAAEDATAVVDVDWTTGAVRHRPGARSDAEICELVRAASSRSPVVVGLDVPLGWPREFVDALSAYHGAVPVWPRWFLEADGGAGPVGQQEARRRQARAVLQYRPTDWAVRGLDGRAGGPPVEPSTDRAGVGAGRFPLSVAADRLGVAAMRGAGLLSRLQRALGRRTPFPRDGRDPLRDTVVEAYPAIGLRRWLDPELVARSYKAGQGAADRRERLLDAVAAGLPGLAVADLRPLCRRSDHVLDALVCALVARAAAVGRTFSPHDADAGGELGADPDAESVAAWLRQRARWARLGDWRSQVGPDRTRVEGWIHVPTGTLPALAPAAR